MAIAEACEVWIEQRIEEELGELQKSGKTLRDIGRDLAHEIEKVFKTKVNSDALRMRAMRKRNKETTIGTNVHEKSTMQKNKENMEFSTPITPLPVPFCSCGRACEMRKRGPKITYRKKCQKCRKSKEKIKESEKAETPKTANITERQVEVWKTVADRLVELENYMMKNCEIPHNLTGNLHTLIKGKLSVIVKIFEQNGG